MRVECFQNSHVTYKEDSYDIFLYFFNYINNLAIISSYYEQTYVFVFKYIFVFKHILLCSIDKSLILVNLNIYMQSVLNIMIIAFFRCAH